MIILIHIQFQALSIVEKSLSAWELTRDLGKSQVDQRSLVTILIPFDHSLSLLLKIFNLFNFL